MSEGEDRLPYWLEPLPDAGEQRELDRWAIERLGVPSLELMEQAGRGLAELVSERAPEGRIVVVCGKGNNGGDGLVAARVLREQGRVVRVLTLANPEEFSGDARANLERLPGRPPSPFESYRLAAASVIVDAILGTGFEGVPREPAASAIAAINEVSGDVAVVACDIPSGVNGSTGEVEGAAVRADATATFHAAKPGLWIAPGKSHAGEVRVVDIGIPDGGPGAPRIGLIDPAVLELVPRRAGDSTKFSAGEVLVCGGSIGLTGAPCLASEAAMRAGAGYVTALVPESLDPIFEVRLLEVMTVPLPDEEGSLTLAAGETVLERCQRAGALVLGPGLGRDPGDTPARSLPGQERLAAAGAGRRRPERPRGPARVAGRAAARDGPDPARRRARAPARDRQLAGLSPPPGAGARRRRGPPTRSCC